MNKVDIEKTMLDGRGAERHTSFTEEGDKIVEIFVEEKRPMHLEKRIVQKHKQIVSEERIEHVNNGEIVEVEVRAIPEMHMEMREHIGVANHATVMDREYATKQDLINAVVEGVATIMDTAELEPVGALSHKMSVAEQIEQRIETGEVKGKSNDMVINTVLGLMIASQMAFAFYFFFM